MPAGRNNRRRFLPIVSKRGPVLAGRCVWQRVSVAIGFGTVALSPVGDHPEHPRYRPVPGRRSRCPFRVDDHHRAAGMVQELLPD